MSPVHRNTFFCSGSVVLFTLYFITQGIALDSSPQVSVTFENDSLPVSVNTAVGTATTIVWTARSDYPSTLQVSLLSSKEARLEEPSKFQIGAEHHYQVTVRGLLIGKTALVFSATVNESSFVLPNRVLVNILRDAKSTTLDRLSTYILSVVIVIFNIGVGLATDIRIVLKVLKKPVGPVIGCCCQFIVMPLIAFAIIKAFNITGVMAFGLFVAGCVPGGGNSNIFCVLLNGYVPMSVTMTTVSVFSSLAMLPLWLYSLGKYILKTNTDYSSISIPFGNIVISLALLVIPAAIGIIIRYKKESIALKISRVMKPMYFIGIIVMTCFMVYVNMYAVSYLSARLVLACLLLPCCGYLVSMAVAAALCQPWQHVFTIAIEAGIQNVPMSYVLTKLIMESPDSDLASIPPLIIMFLQGIPLWVVVIVHKIWFFCCYKKGKCLALDCTKVDENSSSDDKGSPDIKMTHSGDTNKAFEESNDGVTA